MRHDVLNEGDTSLEVDAHDERWMSLALQAADAAAVRGEVPVGAVVVRRGELIAVAGNRREVAQDFCAHAELIAMQQASRAIGSWRLVDCEVYVTLEPCPMCAGAMIQARVARVIYGAADPKGGFLGSCGDVRSIPGINHTFEVRSGVLSSACGDRLRSFFRELRRR